MTDVEKEIAELRKQRPNLEVLVRTTIDYDVRAGKTIHLPGWFVHLMIYSPRGRIVETYSGFGATLDTAWTAAREVMPRRTH